MSQQELPKNEKPPEVRKEELPKPEPLPKGGLGVVAGLVVLAGGLFVGLYFIGEVPYKRQQDELRKQASMMAATPRVAVVKAHRIPGEAERLLPGSTSAWFETAIFARTNGYLKRRLVDIGDVVTEGQLLAEIETPELGDQLDQAKSTMTLHKATLEKNEANLAQAKANEARNRKILTTGAISKEEYDTVKATLEVSAATIGESKAQILVDQANIQRLTDLLSFQKVFAPFRGTITARNIDVGALIVADNPTAAKELFHIMQIDPIKVVVDVPQAFAAGIHPGIEASVTRREDPNRPYKAVVDRTSESLAQQTRTLHTELRIPNKDRSLLPGMYVLVNFRFTREFKPVVVPVASIITRSNGLSVAILGKNNAVTYKKVQLGRDYGSEVEVLSGLEGDETVIIRPGDDLPEGTVVEPVDSSSSK